MELNIGNHKDFCEMLFNLLNSEGIYLIDTGCRSASLKAKFEQENFNGLRPYISVEYQQIDYDDFENAMRVFFDRYSSRGIEAIEDQKGTLYMDNHRVTYDEGEYYSCTCKFHQTTNKVCHHMVAVWIRRMENTLHLKAIKVIKEDLEEAVSYDHDTGKLIIPEYIDSGLYTWKSKRVVYVMLKYGLSVAQIKEYYPEIVISTGYEFINRIGGLVDKTKIKVRLKAER